MKTQGDKKLVPEEIEPYFNDIVPLPTAQWKEVFYRNSVLPYVEGWVNQILVAGGKNPKDDNPKTRLSNIQYLMSIYKDNIFDVTQNHREALLLYRNGLDEISKLRWNLESVVFNEVKFHFWRLRKSIIAENVDIKLTHIIRMQYLLHIKSLSENIVGHEKSKEKISTWIQAHIQSMRSSNKKISNQKTHYVEEKISTTYYKLFGENRIFVAFQMELILLDEIVSRYMKIVAKIKKEQSLKNRIYHHLYGLVIMMIDLITILSLPYRMMISGTRHLSRFASMILSERTRHNYPQLWADPNWTLFQISFKILLTMSLFVILGTLCLPQIYTPLSLLKFALGYTGLQMVRLGLDAISMIQSKSNERKNLNLDDVVKLPLNFSERQKTILMRYKAEQKHEYFVETPTVLKNNSSTKKQINNHAMR